MVSLPAPSGTMSGSLILIQRFPVEIVQFFRYFVEIGVSEYTFYGQGSLVGTLSSDSPTKSW